MTIRKEVLKKIWEWLKTQITPENRKWLKKHRLLWKKVPENSSDFWQWEAEYALTVRDLSYRIQEVLDAKKKRKETETCFGEGLPKQYVLELAELLNIQTPEKTPKYGLLGLILKKIEEMEKEKK